MRANIRMPSTKPHYDYLLVIDFEATCEANTQDYPHEIIEFPIILVDVHELTVVRKYPILNFTPAHPTSSLSKSKLWASVFIFTIHWLVLLLYYYQILYHVARKLKHVAQQSHAFTGRGELLGIFCITHYFHNTVELLLKDQLSVIVVYRTSLETPSLSIHQYLA